MKKYVVISASEDFEDLWDIKIALITENKLEAKEKEKNIKRTPKYLKNGDVCSGNDDWDCAVYQIAEILEYDERGEQ